MTTPLPARRPGSDGRFPFHSPEWARVVRSVYGFEDCSLRGQAGTLPLFHSRSPWLGSKLVSAVYNSYASPLAESVERCDALVAEAVARAQERRVGVLELKGTAPLPDAVVRRHGLERRDRYLQSVLALGPYERVHDGYEPRFRKHLRRAERRVAEAGVSLARERGPAVLAEFHSLLVRCQRDRHAMIAQPRALFDALGRDFLERDRGELFVARDAEGRLAAGLLFLREARVVSGCFAAVRADLRPLSLDAVMKDASIRFYCELGIELYDFGLSSPSQPGLLFAKSRFGAHASVVPWYTLRVRARRVSDLDFATAYPRLRRLYRRVPLRLAEWLPDHLVRFLN